MSRVAWSSLRALIVVLAIALGAAGCGGSSAPSGTPKQQVEAVTTGLFNDLKTGNYAAACNAYSDAVQKVIVTGWEKLSHAKNASCAAALTGILSASAGVKAVLQTLSAPKFDSVSVHGAHASVTITLHGTGVNTRTSFTLDRVGGAWKLGKATALSSL